MPDRSGDRMAGEASLPDAGQRDGRPRFTVILTVTIIAAFTARSIYALRWAPGLSFLDDDSYFYSTASQMAGGHGYLLPFAGSFNPSLPTAEHPPLYPMLLAGLNLLGLVSVDVERFANVSVGTLTVLLIGLLGRRIGSDRVGLLAAGLAAVYPAFIAADGSIMSETLFGALTAAALLQAMRCCERPTVQRTGALGAVIGLAALTRSEGLLLLPLLLVPVAWRVSSGRWRLLVTAALACAVVTGPWVARNWVTFGHPTVTSLSVV